MHTFTPDMMRTVSMTTSGLSNSVPREVHAVGEAVGRLTDETKALRADCAVLRRQLVLIGWTLIGMLIGAILVGVVVAT